jgi:WD40 repeat protein
LVIAWDLAHDRRLDRPFRSPPRHAIAFPVDERGPNGPTILAPKSIDVPISELAIATTPDGGSSAVPDDAGYVDVFDSRTLMRSGRIPVSHGMQVSAVALAPDGRTVAAMTADGHLRFADLRDRRRREPLQPASPEAAWSLAFSGDGRWLATAGLGMSTSAPVQLWDVRGRRRVNTSLLSPPYAVPSAVTFSPDGRKLAAAVTEEMGTGSALEILAVPSLEQLMKIPAPAGSSVQFSPDGRLLVFGDAQGRVWRYDTHTWRPRGRPLLAHTGAVSTLNFSPDGQTLATTSDDGTIRLWYVPSGRPKGNALADLAQGYVAAAFVDRGTHLVTLHDNGRGYLWDIQPQSWARRACEVAGRTLTRAEWNDALPERTYAPACARR